MAKMHTLVRALVENIDQIDVLAKLFLRNNMSNRRLRDLAKGTGLLTERVTGVPYEKAARVAIELREQRKADKAKREVRQLREWVAKDAAIDAGIR